MKYILNESPIKTTNNFNINNIKVELDEINNYEFSEYKINKLENVFITTNIKDNFTSNIGLNNKKYKELNINILKNNLIEELLNIDYEFNELPNLIDEININLEENSKINILLSYNSNNKNLKYFHNSKININLKENSELNITIINEINEISTNILNILSNVFNNSKCIINLIDLIGNKRIYKIEGNTNKNSLNEINNVYIGKNKDLIDMNYYLKNISQNSTNLINVEGVLSDESIKHFKGTIDFKSGSSKSIGKEKENATLLSDKVISKSLPILLCGEEDVEGAHSASQGNIDKDKLFYLESRGLSHDESRKIIIESNVKKILINTPEEICDNILDKIKSYI